MKTGVASKRPAANGAVPNRAALVAAHVRALKRMDEMTKRDGLNLLVRTGIVNHRGKLTRRYGGRARSQAPSS